MQKNKNMIIAAKCAPEEKLLAAAAKAGLKAVELYLSDKMFKDLAGIVKTCKKFNFEYAVHAPNSGLNINDTSRLVREIGARIVVFHNIYWEDEWERIVELFRDLKSEPRLCIENTYSIHEPVKFMRRFNMGRCLDLEHLQMESIGVYEDPFVNVMKEASHIHLTGYVFGSKLWHTHIHESPEHNRNLLNLLKKAQYSGLVVSEARASLQTYEEFKKLNDFYNAWKNE